MPIYGQISQRYHKFVKAKAFPEIGSAQTQLVYLNFNLNIFILNVEVNKSVFGMKKERENDLLKFWTPFKG